jgi:hypothetical protein
MEPTERKVLDFCRSVMRGWRGRKARLQISDKPKRLISMWDGGSKDDWIGVEISTGRLVSLPICGFMNIQPDYQPQPGVALIRHSIFCGKDTGCTVFVHPDDAARFVE